MSNKYDMLYWSLEFSNSAIFGNSG